MSKSPIDMDYNDLDNELDSLLKAEDLPCSVEYSDKRINYYKYNSKTGRISFFKEITKSIKKPLVTLRRIFNLSKRIFKAFLRR